MYFATVLFSCSSSCSTVSLVSRCVHETLNNLLKHHISMLLFAAVPSYDRVRISRSYAATDHERAWNVWKFKTRDLRQREAREWQSRSSVSLGSATRRSSEHGCRPGRLRLISLPNCMI